MKRVQKHKTQLNMFKFHQYNVVLVPNRLKKCDECGSRVIVPIHIKNMMGTIGIVSYCSECGTFHIVHGNPQLESTLTSGFWMQVAGMCENHVRQVKNG